MRLLGVPGNSVGGSLHSSVEEYRELAPLARMWQQLAGIIPHPHEVCRQALIPQVWRPPAGRATASALRLHLRTASTRRLHAGHAVVVFSGALAKRNIAIRACTGMWRVNAWLQLHCGLAGRRHWRTLSHPWPLQYCTPLFFCSSPPSAAAACHGRAPVMHLLQEVAHHCEHALDVGPVLPPGPCEGHPACRVAQVVHHGLRSCMACLSPISAAL